VNKRNLLNLGLLGLAAVLAGLAALESGNKPPPEPAPLLGIDPATVSTLGIERPGTAPVVLQRRQGAWFMLAPSAAPGNQALIDALLKIAAARCPSRYPAGEMPLNALHLDPPLVQLSVDDQKLTFGATDALDGRRYVRHGDSVYLCADLYYYLLNGDAESFKAPTAIHER
jgi:hypothetical protein